MSTRDEDRKTMGRATKALVSEHVRDLMNRFGGGERIAGDLAGFMVYEEMAVLLGEMTERSVIKTPFGERECVIVDGRCDNAFPYEGDNLGGAREVQGRIRLLLTEGAERKFSSPKNPVNIGDHVMFFVAAKLASGDANTFWSTELIVFKDKTKLPPWEEVKIKRPRIEGVPGGRVASETMSASDLLKRPGTAPRPLADGEDPEDGETSPPPKTSAPATTGHRAARANR